jgi:5-methylcytosine-specific restriction endonuclease McrA
VTEPANIACPYSDGTLQPPPPAADATPCVKCGLELPATREYFYGRGEGLRRECKAWFRAAKNARATADRDHYREVARRSYRKADGAAAKRRARKARPELYAELADRYESANSDRHKKRYYRDVEATRTKNRTAYRANPVPRIAATRRWLDAHPAEARALVEKTRARRVAAPGIPPTAEQWAAKIKAFERRCAYCFKPLRNPHMDRIVALGRGGSHDIDNVVPACRTCNQNKAAKDLWAWLDLGDEPRKPSHGPIPVCQV